MIWVVCPSSFISFAQWQYHSQWGLSEAWLLLVENYTQYPALSLWKMGGKRNFWRLLREQSSENQPNIEKEGSAMSGTIWHDIAKSGRLNDIALQRCNLWPKQWNEWGHMYLSTAVVKSGKGPPATMSQNTGGTWPRIRPDSNPPTCCSLIHLKIFVSRTINIVHWGIIVWLHNRGMTIRLMLPGGFGDGNNFFFLSKDRLLEAWTLSWFEHLGILLRHLMTHANSCKYCHFDACQFIPVVITLEKIQRMTNRRRR